MSVKCGEDVVKSRATETLTTKILPEGSRGDSTFDEIFDLIKVLEEDEKSDTRKFYSYIFFKSFLSSEEELSVRVGGASEQLWKISKDLEKFLDSPVGK